MLIESVFLTAHKWIDWGLFTASHGWNYRPYYQFPKIWSYSYGNQGFEVENIYDPFINNAYQAGPIYNSVQGFMHLIGQGPNPTWVKQRRSMERAFAKADRILHYRFSPQMQSRSLLREQYFLKQFSLTLHAQYIYKYFPVLLKDFFQYKVLPPLVTHAPEIFHKIEYTLRRFDYHYANKSLGYHLFIDSLEQLNPPIDGDDRVISYDYIAESGSRLVEQYKNYCYLEEMKSDIKNDIANMTNLYDSYITIAKEEKYKAMANGDPFAARFEPPSLEEYSIQFHNFDFKTKTKILMDLSRVCSDYRSHFGPFDLLMATVHKFWFEHTTPQIYGRYWKEKRIIVTTEEYESKKDLDRHKNNIHNNNNNNNDNNYNNQRDPTLFTPTRYNPLNTLHVDSRLPNEITSQQKVQHLKQQFETSQHDAIYQLDRANVQFIREKFNQRDAPLHHTEQLPRELQTLHANIMNEMLQVLPQNLSDDGFLQPLYDEYYNNRINQHIYKYYPSILEPELKEELDLLYDKSQAEQYMDYIHERVEKRQKAKEERAQILAPYKAIDYMRNNMHQYQISKPDFVYKEIQLEQQPYDSPFHAYPGNVPLNTDDPEVRYNYLQRRSYQKMIKDMQIVQDNEMKKALHLTNGWDSIRRKDQLHNAKWDPYTRIRKGFTPLLKTTLDNHQRFDLSKVTQQDISYASKSFPGVPYDQLIHVLDEHDSYRPPLIDYNKAEGEPGREIVDWIGLPRKRNKMEWGAKAHKDELDRFREENRAIWALQNKLFHYTDDNPNEIKHNFILSKDLQEVKPHIQ